MKYLENDGGRKNAGYKGKTGDCVCRAIAIATTRPYKEIYNLINHYSKTLNSKYARTSSARTGTHRKIYDEIMLKHFGWKWTPTMKIGQGCKTHLRADELPKGRIICRLSRHLVAVIDGVINDTFDCSRGGTRCVYGYYSKDDFADFDDFCNVDDWDE